MQMKQVPAPPPPQKKKKKKKGKRSVIADSHIGGYLTRKLRAIIRFAT